MSEEKIIFLFGDSIARGSYFDFEKKRFAYNNQCYFELLKDKINAKLMNNSRSGNTLPMGLETLNRLLETEPDIVVLAFGGNDSDLVWKEVVETPGDPHYARTDHSVFFTVLKQTIEHLSYEEIIPILLTVPPIDAEKYLDFVSEYNEYNKSRILQQVGSAAYIYAWHERYNAAVIRAASETDARLIDIRTAFLFENNYRDYLCEDGIHPNEKGHALIADCIQRYVLENSSELLKREGFR